METFFVSPKIRAQYAFYGISPIVLSSSEVDIKSNSRLKNAKELVERYGTLNDENDWFGVMRQDLLAYVPWDQAKDLIPENRQLGRTFPRIEYRADLTEKTWESNRTPLTEAAILKELTDYVGFACEKIQDHRQLSCLRSMAHFEIWMWMLGDAKRWAEIESIGMDDLGKARLARICEMYGIRSPFGTNSDDEENMSK